MYNKTQKGNKAISSNEGNKMKKTLFDVLEGILNSGYEESVLADAESVIDYALAASVDINNDQAESIIRVNKHWLDQRENGNGEWSRMAKEAKAALTCYMQTQSGDVATAEMWKSDFDAMDVESWFGLPAEECKELHWLDDNNALIEVEWDADQQEWVEV